jgi:hypothetical protein
MNKLKTFAILTGLFLLIVFNVNSQDLSKLKDTDSVKVTISDLRIANSALEEVFLLRDIVALSGIRSKLQIQQLETCKAKEVIYIKAIESIPEPKKNRFWMGVGLGMLATIFI